MQITAEGIAITTEGIITLASLILALVSIFTLIFKVYRWYLKQEKQDEKIRSIEEENTLLCFGISVSMHDTGIKPNEKPAWTRPFPFNDFLLFTLACLDGLIQLGANHDVSKAKERLDEYINEKAHNQNERKESK